MADIVLTGDTSGAITVAAPAVAGTNTLTLPASTGTLLTTTGDGSGLTNLPSAITSGTKVDTTSGTAVDFTSLPSTVKRITVMFRGVSLNSTAKLLVQLGTSSGLVTTGYISTTNYGSTSGTSYTNGFGMYTGSTNVVSGHMTITHQGSNVFVSSHTCKYNTVNGMWGGGDVDLGGTLDRVRITSSTGTNTFDAGSVNIMYE